MAGSARTQRKRRSNKCKNRERKFWRITCKIYEQIERTPPRAFRDPVESIYQTYGGAILGDSGGYIPQVYLGRVTLFQAREHLSIPWYHYKPQLGWTGLAAEGLENYNVPGNHTSMFDEPHVKVLAEKLKACLDRALIESVLQKETSPVS